MEVMFAWCCADLISLEHGDGVQLFAILCGCSRSVP